MCMVGHSDANTIDEWMVVVELKKLESIMKRDIYDRFAAELQELLQLAWDGKSKTAIESAIALLESGSGDLSSADIEAMRDIMAEDLASGLASQVQDDVEQMIGGIYSQSIDEIAASIARNNIPVINWLNDHHMYWIGNHYDSQVQQRIVRAGSEVLELGLGRREAGEVFREAFGGELNKSQGYWEGLSNHITTRSREFARIDGYTQMEIERYEISAILDNRTSPICRNLDGTIVEVQLAVEQRERIMGASTPDDIKEVAPWVAPDAVLNDQGSVKSSRELAQMGVLMPPFHFNCRTITIEVL